jgi:ABC-type phosphate/phosphonate transport system substrate-binding protein
LFGQHKTDQQIDSISLEQRQSDKNPEITVTSQRIKSIARETGKKAGFLLSTSKSGTMFLRKLVKQWPNYCFQRDYSTKEET